MPHIDNPDCVSALVDDIEEAVGLNDELADGEMSILSRVGPQHWETMQARECSFNLVEVAQGSDGILLGEVDEDSGISLRGSSGVAQLHRDEGKNLARSRA